jgi:methylenetetrahydrofolate--tRNA-(uracil-5-)-methyltransferase
VSHADPAHYDPTNVTFGIIPPIEPAPRGKKDRQLALSRRALDDLERWMTDLASGDAAGPAGRDVA